MSEIYATTTGVETIAAPRVLVRESDQIEINSVSNYVNAMLSVVCYLSTRRSRFHGDVLHLRGVRKIHEY